MGRKMNPVFIFYFRRAGELLVSHKPNNNTRSSSSNLGEKKFEIQARKIEVYLRGEEHKESTTEEVMGPSFKHDSVSFSKTPIIGGLHRQTKRQG